MKYAVITGASKGLGASIAKRMVNEKINIISISRNENIQLKELANEKNLSYTHLSCDLTLPDEVEEKFTKIVESIFQESPEIIYLINNAGMIEPIETVGNLIEQSVVKSVAVNLVAPVIISNLFLEKAKGTHTVLNIMNVTSGAAERPIQGWSTYCSTKAGLNMFTQTAALELENAGSKHQINAFSPGVMDTDMQGTIRSSSKEAFNDLEQFQNYKEKGMLRSAEIVGNALVDLMLSEKIGNGKIYHVNELLK